MVFPSGIFVLNFTLEPNQDNACNTEFEAIPPISTLFRLGFKFYYCSLNKKAPIISDCDLGPKNGLPSKPTKEFYSLQVSAGDPFEAYNWLVFEFKTSLLTLDRIVLFYYCNTTSPSDLFWAVRGDLTASGIGGEIFGCNSNTMRNFTLPLLNASVGETFFLQIVPIFRNITFEIYIGEVQFFSNQITGKLQISILTISSVPCCNVHLLSEVRQRGVLVPLIIAQCTMS